MASGSSNLSLQSPGDNAAIPVAELHAAVIEGNLTKIKTTLADLDRKGVDFVSQCHLLHTAASCGQVEAVRLLITGYKWPVDCRNENEQTPLHVACGNGCLDVIRVLVMKYKADLYARDKDNNTPLHTAAVHGYTDVIEYLIDTFKCDPCTTGCEGKTILHYASYEGHIKLVEVLLKKYQMNPLSNDNNGNNFLHCAIQGGRNELVKVLIEKSNCNYLHMTIDCRNNHNQSPLDVACSNGYLNIAKFLVVQYGLKGHHHDDNLLCVSSRYGQANTVRFLIDELRHNPHGRGRNRMAPLQLAIQAAQIEVVEILLTRCNFHMIAGASLKSITIDGGKIMHFACQLGHLEVIKQLVTGYKFNAIITDDNGNTPLHYSALSGKSEVATLLIMKYGSPVNHRNNKRETPLHLACTKGHLTFI